MKRILRKCESFTLVELLVTIVILVLVIGAVYWAFALGQRAYQEAEMAAEIAQNGRVISERMTREIRQARDIVTELSDDQAGATSTVEFEDGHDITYVGYIRYFWEEQDNTIKREKIAYYFSDSGDPNNPNTYVAWNATPPAGETLETVILESSQIIGEYVNDLQIWGSSLINIALTLEKKDKILDSKTKVFGRNL